MRGLARQKSCTPSWKNTWRATFCREPHVAQRLTSQEKVARQLLREAPLWRATPRAKALTRCSPGLRRSPSRPHVSALESRCSTRGYIIFRGKALTRPWIPPRPFFRILKKIPNQPAIAPTFSSIQPRTWSAILRPKIGCADNMPDDLDTQHLRPPMAHASTFHPQ